MPKKSAKRKKPQKQLVTPQKPPEETTVATQEELVITELATEAVITTAEPAKPKRHISWLIVVIAGMVVLLAGAVTLYFVLTTQKSKENPTLLAATEAKKLVAKVGTIAELPQGENPTIATVSDVTKLRNQAFFALAENGDKVLIYPTAKKAYLYRPGTGKLVDIGPITIQGEGKPAVAGASATAQITSSRVVVDNGTTVAGIAKKGASDLEGHVKNITIIEKGDADAKPYAKSVVVDLTGRNQTQAEAIASYIGSSVSTLPKGETKPTNADILVILGSDYKAK